MVRNIKYTSIKRVLDNLLDHPLLRDVDLDQAVRHVLRFIQLHGFPQLFQDKLADIEINHFRGELPCDLISIQQVRDKCTGICLRAMTKSFNPGLKDYSNNHHKPPHPDNNGFSHLVNGNPVPRYMDGMDRWCDHTNRHCTDDEMSFKTQGRVIYTSFPKGVVEIAYKAIPVDEDGYPLLIDDENYLAALEAYIKVKVFTVKFDTGKLSAPILLNAQTDYAWLSAQLMDTMTIPSISEMEVITRMWNNLLPHRYEFDNQFKELGNREYTGRHLDHGRDLTVVHVPVPTEQQPNSNDKSDNSNSTIDNETVDWDDAYVEDETLILD